MGGFLHQRGGDAVRGLQGREVAFGVQRCGAAGPGGGDRLPVAVVDGVAAGEHSGQVGDRGGCLDLDVALIVQLDLAGYQFGARDVADGDEDAGGVLAPGFSGAGAGKPGKFSTSVVFISAPPAVTAPARTRGFRPARAA